MMKKRHGRQWVSTPIHELGRGIKSSPELLEKINNMVNGTSAEHEISVRLGTLHEEVSKMNDEEFKFMLIDRMDKLINAINAVDEQLGNACHELEYISNNVSYVEVEDDQKTQ